MFLNTDHLEKSSYRILSLYLPIAQSNMTKSGCRIFPAPDFGNLGGDSLIQRSSQKLFPCYYQHGGNSLTLFGGGHSDVQMPSQKPAIFLFPRKAPVVVVMQSRSVLFLSAPSYLLSSGFYKDSMMDIWSGNDYLKR